MNGNWDAVYAIGAVFGLAVIGFLWERRADVKAAWRRRMERLNRLADARPMPGEFPPLCTPGRKCAGCVEAEFQQIVQALKL